MSNKLLPLVFTFVAYASLFLTVLGLYFNVVSLKNRMGFYYVLKGQGYSAKTVLIKNACYTALTLVLTLSMTHVIFPSFSLAEILHVPAHFANWLDHRFIPSDINLDSFKGVRQSKTVIIYLVATSMLSLWFAISSWVVYAVANVRASNVAEMRERNAIGADVLNALSSMSKTKKFDWDSVLDYINNHK